MGFGNFQANIFNLTKAQSKLNKQIMHITNQRDIITARITALMADGVDSSVDPEIKLLQYQDNSLDMEQKSIETQLSVITENLEKIEKQQEDNIKKEVPKLSL